MLPVVVGIAAAARQILVYSIVTVVVSFALVPATELGWIYGIAALVLGVMFIAGAASLVRRRHARAGDQVVRLLEHVPRAAVRRHCRRRPRPCRLSAGEAAFSSAPWGSRS